MDKIGTYLFSNRVRHVLSTILTFWHIVRIIRVEIALL